MDAGGNRRWVAEGRQAAAVDHGNCRGASAGWVSCGYRRALRGRSLAGQLRSLSGHETRRYEDTLSDQKQVILNVTPAWARKVKPARAPNFSERNSSLPRNKIVLPKRLCLGSNFATCYLNYRLQD